jgi:hypothetical protein
MFAAQHGAPPERGIILTEGYKHLAALRPLTIATHDYPTSESWPRKFEKVISAVVCVSLRSPRQDLFSTQRTQTYAENGRERMSSVAQRTFM